MKRRIVTTEISIQMRFAFIGLPPFLMIAILQEKTAILSEYRLPAGQKNPW